MARSVKAAINPGLLTWARESAGLSLQEAAAKIKQSPDVLRQWEAGEAHLTVSKLRELSRIYNRSLATFYLSTPPRDYQRLRDFRRLTSSESARLSPKLVQENRRAHERRELAIDLLGQLDEEIPSFTLSIELTEDAENIAPRIRRFLGVSLTDQKKLRDSYKALDLWKGALENAGVLVFHAPHIDLAEMRGFSISETPLPVIVLNPKDSPHARIFTLIHEFAHILSRCGGICNLLEQQRRPQEKRIEIFCNSVSGATLVPGDDLLRHAVLRGRDSRKPWSDEEVSALAGDYSVSREVILRRLLDLELVTKEFYGSKFAHYQEQYRDHKSDADIRIPYSARVLGREGSFFAGLVLRSYGEGIITSSEVSDYLQIKLNRLAELERRLWAKAS